MSDNKISFPVTTTLLKQMGSHKIAYGSALILSLGQSGAFAVSPVFLVQAISAIKEMEEEQAQYWSAACLGAFSLSFVLHWARSRILEPQATLFINKLVELITQAYFTNEMEEYTDPAGAPFVADVGAMLFRTRIFITKVFGAIIPIVLEMLEIIAAVSFFLGEVGAIVGAALIIQGLILLGGARPVATGQNKYMKELYSFMGYLIPLVTAWPFINTYGILPSELKKIRGKLAELTITTNYNFLLKAHLLLASGLTYSLSIFGLGIFMMYRSGGLIFSFTEYQLYLMGLYLFRLAPLLKDFSETWNELVAESDYVRTVLGKIEKMTKQQALQKQLPDIVTKPNAPAIEFKNVIFQSTKKGVHFTVLNRFFVKIGHGERLAIVGKTGAGKSTFLNLLMKFYLPTEGAIYVGGIDITQVNDESLRKIFAVALQDTNAFDERLSIEENIRRSTTQEVTDAQINKVIEMAELSAVVKRHGSDPIGRGILSGGERKRMAVACALLVLETRPEASILVLDEPTAGLDPDTRKIFFQGLLEYNQEKKFTIINITHEEAELRYLDEDKDKLQVIVLDKGEIKEQGLFKKLKEGSGPFTQLFKLPNENEVAESKQQNEKEVVESKQHQANTNNPVFMSYSQSSTSANLSHYDNSLSPTPSLPGTPNSFYTDHHHIEMSTRGDPKERPLLNPHSKKSDSAGQPETEEKEKKGSCLVM